MVLGCYCLGVVVFIVFCVLIVGCLWLVTAFMFGFLRLGFVLCVMRVFGFVVAVLIWVAVLVLGVLLYTWCLWVIAGFVLGCWWLVDWCYL